MTATKAPFKTKKVIITFILQPLDFLNGDQTYCIETYQFVEEKEFNTEI